MKIGVLFFPEYPWPITRDLWQRAEALGVDHAWTYDHLAWKSLRDSPWYGAVPTLTAAAAVTSRIRLGTLVASPNFRHPVTFARDLITIDAVSEGRLTIGIGAGGYGWDSTILGQAQLSPVERADRFEEFVELLDQLLRNPATTWQGRYFEASEARSVPGCVQSPRIPFGIAATGKRGMALAARYGEMWITTGDGSSPDPMTPEAGARAVGRQIERLKEICNQAGRDFDTMRLLVLSGSEILPGLDSAQMAEDTLGRFAEIGVTDYVVHWPRAEGLYAGDVAAFEDVLSHALS